MVGGRSAASHSTRAMHCRQALRQARLHCSSCRPPTPRVLLLQHCCALAGAAGEAPPPGSRRRGRPPKSAAPLPEPPPPPPPPPPPQQQQQAAAEAVAAAAPAQPPKPKPKLLLIDGHNLAFRAFYGIQRTQMGPLMTTDGIPTSVAFGFLRSLIALLEQERPAALLAAFDSPTKTFRHGALPGYKASRRSVPSEFRPDLRNTQLLLRFMRVPMLSVPGYEADDVLAGVARQASRDGQWAVRIVSTDQDLFQVVDDAADVAVVLPNSLLPSKQRAQGRSGSSKAAAVVDEAAVAARLGVPPALVPDLKALMGDSSDDLPGLRGIGPKTAAQLLQQHSSLEGVLAADPSSHRPAVAAKLAGQQEAAALYKSIARVRPEAVADVDPAAFRLAGYCAREVAPLLERLEMRSLLAKVDASLQALLGGRAPPRADLAAELPVALQLLELPGARQVAAVPAGQLAVAASAEADEDEAEEESKSVQLDQEHL